MTIERALISVSDKTGIVELGRALTRRGVALIASGGTARALREGGLEVTPVSDVTGCPEILGGRVKTLHPAVHGGILSRRSDEDRRELAAQGWGEIDLAVVNLYPFEEAAADPEATEGELIEQIDIGGVALLRAAAKAFRHVTVVCDPADYGLVLEEMEAHGDTLEATRRRLAAKAFRRTAAYDAVIEEALAKEERALPDRRVLRMDKHLDLRYGENPHQQAALYALPGSAGPLGGELLQGKPLSYNNLLDLDAAWRAAAGFERPTAVVVKHVSPCGIGSAERVADAVGPAIASDPVSAFGSVVALNRQVDGSAVDALGDLFVEAVAAPSFTAEAQGALGERTGCRVVRVGSLRERPVEFRSIRGGVLVQEVDRGDRAEWRVVTERQPNEEEMAALRFTWRAVASVKSNAIVLGRGEATVGIGGGLPSRVDAVRLAVAKAGERAAGSVMASDAFFPFPDGIEFAAEAGVRAVVQPGGSVRDEEVIAAADRLGLAMCFTGVRHFRH
jgi:phosphoribosylaminoimidazolecarboxamide formyltransferase/IMP cyclohydrolase